jgi:palmitoyltransferase
MSTSKKLLWPMAAMSTTSESTRPSSDNSTTRADSIPTSIDGYISVPEDAESHDLPFANVAIAQYHKIHEKLAANNIFRILRSPAPIRVWVYRSLLVENWLWNDWDRPSARPDMDKEARDEGVDGSMDDMESLRDSEADSVDGAHARPYLTRLRLALAPYCVHFNNPGYIRDDTLRMLERDVVKKTLEETRKSLEMREELGLSWEFWDALAEVVKAAIPSLERRCFAAPDPAAPEYEGLSGPLIASYSPSLLRDLERLNQLVCIARNVQVHGEKVQNLSAERLFDKDIFALINVCVRVTARGYDGEAGTQDEDKWQGVINAYKKLLITCLQFLNNLIARNEQRKLMLWIELFDSHLDNELPNFADMKYKLDEFNQQEQPFQPDTPDPMGRPSRSLDTFKIPQQPASSPFLLYIGETGNDVKKALQQHGVKAGANDIAAECRRRWQTMSEEEKNVSYHCHLHRSLVDFDRNGTCSMPTSLPDTVTKSRNRAHTRRWLINMQKTKKAYKRWRRASTSCKSKLTECAHPSPPLLIAHRTTKTPHPCQKQSNPQDQQQMTRYSIPASSGLPRQVRSISVSPTRHPLEQKFCKMARKIS